MIATEKMESILFKCHIIKEFAALPESILGYYYCNEVYSIILLNEIIRNSNQLYRCVLAEEIGHYWMTLGDITPRKHMCYRDRIAVDKQELLALKWATDFLIPTGMLLKVLKDNPDFSQSDLIDYFCVTSEFLLHKLKFVSRQNSFRNT